MQRVKISLFGRFEATSGTGPLEGLTARKVQELFCLLALSPDRSLSREVLADRLWPEATAPSSRKYLRQVLWQLRRALDTDDSDSSHFLVTSDWISFVPGTTIQVDVLDFEDAYGRMRNLSPRGMLKEADRGPLIDAAAGYRGDLLESWYSEWCVEARWAYRRMYGEMLDRLVEDCSVRGAWTDGISYSEEALRYDRANERAHCHLIKLYSCTNNRTAALRQYQRCATALREELGVDPSAETKELIEQVRSSGRAGFRPVQPLDPAARVRTGFDEAVPKIHEAIAFLRELEGQLKT